MLGHFKATGNVPRFIETLKIKGDLRVDMAIFKSQATPIAPDGNRA